MYLDFILDQFNKYKDKEAIIYKEKVYSYEWLYNSYKKWQQFFLDNKVEKNSIIAIESDFNPDSITVLLAAIEHGAILVPISPAIKNTEYYIETAEVEYSIDLNKGETKLIKHKREVKHDLLLELKEKRKTPGLVLFSSGTTGKPKAALHDMIPLLNKFKVIRHTLRTVTFLLFDHIGGFNTLFYILSNGGTIVALENRSPEEVCRLIEKYSVELLPTSPTFINMLLFSQVYKRYDLSSLKLISYGTEPMPKSTLEKLHELFPDIKLKQTYGLSEIGIMRTKSENSNSLWVKVGGEDYETKIVDGKLLIKAKTAMLGYLNAPLPFDEDGWFHTGDRVEQKGEYLRILGRDSELINVGGEKVYPIEVESVLLEIDGVLDAVIKGEDNPMTGKVVTATIKVEQENMNNKFKKKIKKYCRSRLEKYKVPVKIDFTDEDLNSARFKKKR